ncbi:hypothetical protein LBMAG27_19020 [Bacteroidota bacterium]|nr:hypothetical protein LBMAG27_19020 [Bacteroidota bacterium]
MNRLEVIQLLINHTKAKNYLEIGVFDGRTFLEVKAKRKHAVDPSMKISNRYKFHSIRYDFKNLMNKYFHQTSDAYFESQQKKLEQNKIDVAFIDGLHTYTQTLMDVKNVLIHLNTKGIIVMHDCSPPTKASGWPANSLENAITLNIPDFKNEWCGDSWKAIHHLIEWNKKFNALDIFVLNCDYGLGIVKPKNNFSVSMLDSLKPDSIYETLSYEFLNSNRSGVINLKEENYIREYLNKNP